jgi:hypothetical protein
VGEAHAPPADLGAAWTGQLLERLREEEEEASVGNNQQQQAGSNNGTGSKEVAKFNESVGEEELAGCQDS